jgi:hypothetical protein
MEAGSWIGIGLMGDGADAEDVRSISGRMAHPPLFRPEGASRILIARALCLPLLGRNYMIRRSTVRITRVTIAMAPIDMR